MPRIGGAGGGDQLLLADGQAAEQRRRPAGRSRDRRGSPAPRAPWRAAAAGRSVDVSSPRNMLAATVRWRQSTTSWCTALMPSAIASCGRGEADRSRPARRSRRPVRGMTPVRSLIRVDLPAPFSPTMAWISPAPEGEVCAASARACRDSASRARAARGSAAGMSARRAARRACDVLERQASAAIGAALRVAERRVTEQSPGRRGRRGLRSGVIS